MWVYVLENLRSCHVSAPKPIPSFLKWAPPVPRSLFCSWSPKPLLTPLFPFGPPPNRHPTPPPRRTRPKLVAPLPSLLLRPFFQPDPHFLCLLPLSLLFLFYTRLDRPFTVLAASAFSIASVIRNRGQFTLWTRCGWLYFPQRSCPLLFTSSALDSPPFLSPAPCFRRYTPQNPLVDLSFPLFLVAASNSCPLGLRASFPYLPVSPRPRPFPHIGFNARCFFFSISPIDPPWEKSPVRSPAIFYSLRSLFLLP